MSRLDLVTTLIVGVCVLAIAFLIYKFGFQDRQTRIPGEEPPVTAPITEDLAEEDDLYNDETTTTGEPVSDEANSTDSPSTPSSTDMEKEDAAAEKAYEERNVNTSPSGDFDGPPRTIPGSGAYMVMGNSYRQKINAEKEVRDLKAKGYSNATYHLFNTGTYATIVVDRFDSPGKAERIAEEVKAATGINAYVQKIRYEN